MSDTAKSSSDYVLITKKTGVMTIMMNRPKKLNGWTMPMMEAFKKGLSDAASDDETKAVILTGQGRYYSAGVNLGGTLQFGHPKKLHAQIVAHNQELFEVFLTFPKPILVAANGPAIGASVTSATLCNGIIAAEEATFSTPFAALGIPPEGCSSVHFARLMNEDNAQRMLGKEGWKPTAKEALEAGLIQWCVPADQLLEKAQEIAEEWVEKGEERRFLGGSQLEELKAVNAEESVRLADAFLSTPFLKNQFQFLWSKKKWAPAATFLTLWLSRPLWSLMLR
jgi:enoyl-CoA hydratase/carnithine racemase